MTDWQPGDPLLSDSFESVGWVRQLFELVPDVDCYPQRDGTCRSAAEARWPGRPWPEDDTERAALAAKVGWRWSLR